ncbi:MAG: histidine--tRNA ligase [Culicoidibacterales bacterium]
MNKMQKPRGTQDIFGDAIAYWHYIESHVRKLTKIYQYGEMRTPMFEKIELFARGVGETSDIVSKEMYAFEDKKGRKLALKPESTATIVRSYIENKLFSEGEYNKFYYISPHFRYERAQMGRYRQHHQFGVEVFGDKDPTVDVEVILFAVTFLAKIGIKDYTVKINSLGDSSSRLAYREALQEYFSPVLSELCEDCKQRFIKNPLRILDCKVDAKHEAIKNAPKMSQYLTPSASHYIKEVHRLLTHFNISYQIDDTLVRGLDYYTNTVFEIVLNNPTSAKAGSLCGGGRYDGLIAENGGPNKSGMGFGMGIERLIIALQEQHVLLPPTNTNKVFVGNLDAEISACFALEITQKLRSLAINADMNFGLKSMKSLFKMSDRFEATHIIIIGKQESESQTFTVKDLQTKEQTTITTDKLAAYFK